MSAAHWIPLLLLAYFWWEVIRQLALSWSTDPQYSYGYAVPILCVVLIWKGITLSGSSVTSLVAQYTSRFGSAKASRRVAGTLAGLGLLWFVLRLFAEGAPEFRLLGWGMAFVAATVTFLLGRIVFGTRLVRQWLFPVLFFCVAIPWPRAIEHPLMLSLQSATSWAASEALSLLGLPALLEGNVIQVASGRVGVDEACSGIRSFQASLMIAMFLGGLYRLSVARRFVLCLAGLALSLAFNVIRASLLTWIAAKHGLGAVGNWHDPIALAILACSLLLLLTFGISLRSQSPKTGLEQSGPESQTVPGLRALSLARVSWGLFVSCLATEILVASWYGARSEPLLPAWCFEPAPSLGARLYPVSPSVLSQLGADESSAYAWEEPGGITWRSLFFRWHLSRDRIRVMEIRRAQVHVPEVCLVNSGKKFIKDLGTVRHRQGQQDLQFRCLQFEDRGVSLFVFFCATKAEPLEGNNPPERTALRALRAVRDRRNWEALSTLEVAVWGMGDSKSALQSFRTTLSQLLVTATPRPAS